MKCPTTLLFYPITYTFTSDISRNFYMLSLNLVKSLNYSFLTNIISFYIYKDDFDRMYKVNYILLVSREREEFLFNLFFFTIFP